MASALLASLFALLAGCSKSSSPKEPPVTGKRNDPPIELRGEWKPGWRYHMRLEHSDTTVTQGEADPHEVSLAHEYAVTVTNVMPNGNRGLEVEFLSLEMQRSKGTTYTLVYDSATDKPMVDEHRYGEALNNMIGRRVRYLLSPSNTVLRIDGQKDLLPAPLPRAPANTNTAGSGPVDPAAAAPPPRSPLDRRRAQVVSNLRDIFDNDYLKLLVELDGLPPGPVRVGDTWPWQRQLSAKPVGRLFVDATNSFRGWQARGQTNCARLEATGTISGRPRALNVLRVLTGAAPLPPTNAPAGPAVANAKFTGLIWFNPDLGLPIDRQLHHSFSFPGTRSFQLDGTNSVSERVTKTLHQATVIKLLALTPLELEKAP